MPHHVFDLFRSKDHDIFKKLFLKFFDYTFAYFLVRTGHRQDSEDLNQILWARVYEKANQFAGSSFGEFFSWVKKMAYRELLSRPLRKEVTCDLGDVAACGLTPEQHASLQEAAERMVLAMYALRDSDRDILLLCFYQQLSHDEVAALLGVTKQAARVRLHRALVRYGRVLEDRGSRIGKTLRPAELGQTLSWALPLARAGF